MEFEILTWSTYGDRPEVTFVTVGILEPIDDIKKRTEYQFEVDGRFDSITDDFILAVEQKLIAANLLIKEV